MILGAITWANPWPILIPGLSGVLTICLAVELVISLVRSSVTADSSGEDV